mmetsp:Transcript_4220/g.10546  ORF Transcript_4220/g.10546 Transcript_4220/m.10546 type:complete len:327 (-) Transcript_4220:753-1733(-)
MTPHAHMSMASPIAPPPCHSSGAMYTGLPMRLACTAETRARLLRGCEHPKSHASTLRGAGAAAWCWLGDADGCSSELPVNDEVRLMLGLNDAAAMTAAPACMGRAGSGADSVSDAADATSGTTLFATAAACAVLISAAASAPAAATSTASSAATAAAAFLRALPEKGGEARLPSARGTRMSHLDDTPALASTTAAEMRRMWSPSLLLVVPMLSAARVLLAPSLAMDAAGACCGRCWSCAGDTVRLSAITCAPGLHCLMAPPASSGIILSGTAHSSRLNGGSGLPAMWPAASKVLADGRLGSGKGCQPLVAWGCLSRKLAGLQSPYE